jgi:hypothetical protein
MAWWLDSLVAGGLAGWMTGWIAWLLEDWLAGYLVDGWLEWDMPILLGLRS